MDQPIRCKICGKSFVRRKSCRGEQICSEACRKTARSITNRRHDLKRRYGLSYEKYERLLQHQDYACAICCTPMQEATLGPGTRLMVDHDHKTGEVRGLLCDPCNRGLGMFQEEDLNLLRAIEYLDDPPAKEILDHEDEC